MGPGEHTAEFLFIGNTKGDYHDSINAKNFDEWVKERLVPTFEAKFPGKRMILVLDNAPYVRERVSGSRSDVSKPPSRDSYHHNIELELSSGMTKAQYLALLQKHGACACARACARARRPRGHSAHGARAEAARED